MSALSLPCWQFIIAGPLLPDPNLLLSLIRLTSCVTFGEIPHSCLRPEANFDFIYAFYPVPVVHHTLSLFSRLPSVESQGRKWSLTPARVNTPPCRGAFKLCLFSKLYVCERCSGDPHTPSILTAPPMIFHSWPLSSILHGKIPQRQRKEGGPPIRNVASHPSV